MEIIRGNLMISPAVEHTLSILSTIAYVWPCYTRGGFPLVVQGYFLTKYLKVLLVIQGDDSRTKYIHNYTNVSYTP